MISIQCLPVSPKELEQELPQEKEHTGRTREEKEEKEKEKEKEEEEEEEEKKKKSKPRKESSIKGNLGKKDKLDGTVNRMLEKRTETKLIFREINFK